MRLNACSTLSMFNAPMQPVGASRHVKGVCGGGRAAGGLCRPGSASCKDLGWLEWCSSPVVICLTVIRMAGLDARAAAIVIRSVKKTSQSGRTVIVTIHQPSVEIFEAFDALVLLQRGGKVAGTRGPGPDKLSRNQLAHMPDYPHAKDLQACIRHVVIGAVRAYDI